MVTGDAVLAANQKIERFHVIGALFKVARRSSLLLLAVDVSVF